MRALAISALGSALHIYNMQVQLAKQITDLFFAQFVVMRKVIGAI
jgi:hypothetical protein